MFVAYLHYILTPILFWKTGLHFVDQVEELFVLCGEVQPKEALLGRKEAVICPRLCRVDEANCHLFVFTSAVFDVISFTQVKVNASIFSSTLMMFEISCFVASFVLGRLVPTYCLKGKCWLFVIFLVAIALLLAVVGRCCVSWIG